MADIKLYYFNSRGRAELIRLVLTLGGCSFEDIRYQRDEWHNYKDKAPFGQIPYIEYNGKKYGQSVAIASFFAKELGLYGASNLDALRIDEVMAIAQDMFMAAANAYKETDEVKKVDLMKKLREEDLPRMFGFFTNLLNDNKTGFFVGNDLTLADLCAYDMIFTMRKVFEYDAAATFPELKALEDKVVANAVIKAYLSQRKNTPT